MKNTWHELAEQYTSALQDHLAGAGEAGLQRVYELGRQAIADGLGVLEMAALHHEAMAAVWPGTFDETAQKVKAAESFFVESLAPFEIAHRGFREANAALRHNEEHFRSLIENALDIIAILDADGTICYNSPSVERVLGYKPEELIGKKAFEFVHPNDLPKVITIFTHGIQIPGYTASIEFRFRHRDGSWHILESIGKNLLTNPAVAGVIVNSRDITERKRAEEALRQQTDLHESLLKAQSDLGEGVVIVEGERIIYANDALCKIYGYSAAELFTPPSFLELVVPEERALLAERLRQRLNGESTSDHNETTILNKNGHRVNIEYAVKRVQIGDRTQLFAIIRDITERKQAEEALRRLNEMLEEGVKRIAHALHDEAGQLFAAVHIALAEVAYELPPPVRMRLQKVRGLLDQIEEQLRRLSHELRPTILDDLGLRPALEFLADGVSKRAGVLISVKGLAEGRLPPLIETTLYRIVQEALTNVTKHARATHVWIQLQREARMIRCAIKDNGIGFNMPSILEKKGERGLGLIGIRERLGTLGGTLEILSAPGQGTELLITVPLET